MNQDMTDSFVPITSENALIVDSVRRIITAYGRRRFLDRARSGDGIDDLWQELAAAGLIGAPVPPDYGGSGLGVEIMSLMLQELAAEGCPLPVIVLLTARSDERGVGQGWGQQYRTRWLTY